MRFRAVLTGASGGIGRAMAAALAPHCDSLVLVGRDRARLSPVDAKSSLLHADITNAEGRNAIACASPDVNLLVNNAGVSEFIAFADQSDAAMERIFAVNVLAAMQLTRRLLPALLAQPAAMIVNVGSVMGYLGYPGCAAYSASKFALRGFSEALRRELADTRVRVMHLAPRTTRTAMNGAALDALNAELGNAADAPETVALRLISLLQRPAGERLIGMPEALFARLNQLAPALVDAALRRQLPTIRRHLAKETPP
ncbi:MAG TPA: SDR family oxidoreductase [Burkholderiales bacterium]|nr:SDR family oxidoreductase [Burkholderiales bacterium]